MYACSRKRREMRRSVLGAEYVERSIVNVGEFNSPRIKSIISKSR
jgi:hypothetical protein